MSAGGGAEREGPADAMQTSTSALVRYAAICPCDTEANGEAAVPGSVSSWAKQKGRRQKPTPPR